MINSDWEGPWVTADHAFDIMRKGIKKGDRLFEIISAYDDYLAYIVKKQDYEPGDTLRLIAPFLIAFGLDNSFLVDKAKDNANFIAGSIEALKLLVRLYTLNIISTSYHQYVHYSTSLAGIPVENTYCTYFDIDKYALDIPDADKDLVKEMAVTIIDMHDLNIDMDTRLQKMDSSTSGYIQQLDQFFWSILPATGFSRVLTEVQPLGGIRKFDAVIHALQKEGRDLARSATIGDSITDWKMLKSTKDAGGLALSFNGNEYAVSNCNVAVMSKNCMVTALLVDVFEKGGLDAVKALISDWGWDSIEKMYGKGLVEQTIYNAFRNAYTADLPLAVWVNPQNLENTIAASKRLRKSVRGMQIGSLG
jgi:energy-converting hydrogenase A subunit R